MNGLRKKGRKEGRNIRQTPKAPGVSTLLPLEISKLITGAMWA